MIDQKPCKGLFIKNIHMDRVNKDHFLKRWQQERKYGDLAVAELNSWRPEIIISANTPLMAQKKIIGWADRKRVTSVFWLHDLLSVAARSIISDIHPVIGRLAYAYLNRIEVRALSRADHIIAITDDFIPFLRQWHIDPTKIGIIPNWGPIERIPVLQRRNFFSDQHGLNDKFVVLYSGTLGKKQGISLIIETATKLTGHDDICFVIATDERGHDYLKWQLAGRVLPNLMQLPLQTPSRYPYLLASADLLLVSLDKEAGAYCVPSKLWAAFCAQRASIVAIDRENLCARITNEISAGVVISPNSVDQCVSAITELKINGPLRLDMGKRARRYAERFFPISNVADTFETILEAR